MKDTLRFWLNKGVAGFRVDTIMTLFEVGTDANGNYPDEPESGECLDDPQSPCFLNHIYTKDQNETYDMAYQWRAVLDEFGGDKRIMMTEAYSSLENIQRYYGDGLRNGSQIPFNFHLLTKTFKESSGHVYKKLIDEWLERMPAGVEANWVVSTHIEIVEMNLIFGSAFTSNQKNYCNFQVGQSRSKTSRLKIG